MKKIRKAVFPVAGLGTRFLPATKATPKELLPVIDKPLIQFAMDEARAAGIEQFIFVTAAGKGALGEAQAHSRRTRIRGRRRVMRATLSPRCPAGKAGLSRSAQQKRRGCARSRAR